MGAVTEEARLRFRVTERNRIVAMSKNELSRLAARFRFVRLVVSMVISIRQTNKAVRYDLDLFRAVQKYPIAKKESQNDKESQTNTE